ncbi:hypothetical protein CA850_19490 [Micromonospora echinospora]|nr:hypothetical protein CA850_19490 [Micromonospora echinospora]
MTTEAFMSFPAFLTDSQSSLSLAPPAGADGAGAEEAEAAGAEVAEEGEGADSAVVSSPPPQPASVREAQINTAETTRNDFTGADASRSPPDVQSGCCVQRCGP